MDIIEKSKIVFKKIWKNVGIDYAVIFGSASREALNVESDVDFGIKFRRLSKSSKILLRKIIRIKKALEDELKRSVDIVVLNKANLGLCYEIFSTGKPVFLSNEEKFMEEKIKTLREYLDFKYYIQRHFEEKVERLLYGE
ncbi:MAG: nucleotidyltransferase domain-containing protein [Candidatus Aenigmarchaeota archaeon]|nr:nucleotidyltransferase domain-containing protein [Candidatus Aenigmarchaeota archaeon]